MNARVAEEAVMHGADERHDFGVPAPNFVMMEIISAFHTTTK